MAAYDRQGRQDSARLASSGRRPGPRCLEQAEVGGGEGVGPAEGTHRDVMCRPVADPGKLLETWRWLRSGSAPGSSTMRRSATASGQLDDGPGSRWGDAQRHELAGLGPGQALGASG